MDAARYKVWQFAALLHRYWPHLQALAICSRKAALGEVGGYQFRERLCFGHTFVLFCCRVPTWERRKNVGRKNRRSHVPRWFAAASGEKPEGISMRVGCGVAPVCAAFAAGPWERRFCAASTRPTDA